MDQITGSPMSALAATADLAATATLGKAAAMQEAMQEAMNAASASDIGRASASSGLIGGIA